MKCRPAGKNEDMEALVRHSECSMTQPGFMASLGEQVSWEE